MKKQFSSIRNLFYWLSDHNTAITTFISVVAVFFAFTSSQSAQGSLNQNTLQKELEFKQSLYEGVIGAFSENFQKLAHCEYDDISPSKEYYSALTKVDFIENKEIKQLIETQHKEYLDTYTKNCPQENFLPEKPEQSIVKRNSASMELQLSFQTVTCLMAQDLGLDTDCIKKE